MKKLSLIFLAYIFVFCLLGCSQVKEISTEQGELAWSERDFKDTDKKLKQESTVKVAMSGVGRRTPFRRKQDLPHYSVYLAYDPEDKTSVDLAWDFGKFKNIFFYENQKRLAIAKGARTFDESGQLVAEARLVRFLENGQQLQRFEVEEFHYGLRGNLVFTCKSQYDDLGAKVSQTETNGKKNEDYYFIWAVGF